MASYRLLLFVAPPVIVLFGALGGMAQEDEAAVARTIVASHTDTDSNGVIDQVELAHNLAAAFVSLDVNADGQLAEDELEIEDPNHFARVDANGDGMLAFDEVMAAKIEDITAVDTNGDAALSPDELAAMDQLR